MTTPKALPHQVEGTQFLRDRKAAGLFDEQGLGKTKQLIDALVGEISDQVIDGALIVCPNILKATWKEEVQKHSALRPVIFGSGKSARKTGFRSLLGQVFIINYEAVAAELPSLRALLRFKRMALVLDESHRIKTPDSKVTQAVLALKEDAARRFIMSGTPVANKPEDIWSQAYFLDDGAALGATFDEFKRQFKQGAAYTDLDVLRDRMSDLALRRRKEGTIELPPKTIIRVPVHLAGRQLTMYEKMRDELALWVRTLDGEDILKHGEDILARLVRLAQLASNPALLDQSFEGAPAKFSTLDHLIDRYLLESGSKLIVWSSFVNNIEALVRRYPQYQPVCLHGEMRSDARDANVRLFKTDESVRLLIANPAAAREGLTLTVANTAIYVDRTFNLVDYLQSQDRIHRISQTKACEVVLLVAQGTIDEFIDFSLLQKLRVAEYAQGDRDEIDPLDLTMTKPAILQALIG